MGQTPFQRLARKLKMTKEHHDLLRQALTHKSYLGEAGQHDSNERLEFLGDSVLGLVVAEHLFAEYAEKQEGELAKAKAVAVSEVILAECAKKAGVPDAILMSTGEEMSGGRARPSILSDAFEAIIAAVYFSRGLDAAKEFILTSLGPILEDIEGEEHQRNYKSILQELTQGIYRKAPKYTVTAERGADHDKTFTVEVQLDGTILGRGDGKSKKMAEQAAAFEALRHPIFKPKPGRKRKK
jgi:ribonuclease III